jgi:outer membrane protein assembly factor BamB
MRKLTALAVIVWLALPLSHSVFAASSEWPQWRGPNRDGLSAEAGLLKEWPKDGPPLLWKASGLGAGFSGVSVAGQRIFTMGDQPDGNHVLALNCADGKLLWSTKLGKAGAPGWGGFKGPRATPSVDDGLVFALGQFGEVICVSAADGKEVWRKHLTTDLGGPLMEWGFSESPLVDGDQVLFTPGGPKGTMVALNKKTGGLIWQSKDWTDNAHYSSIIVAEIDGLRHYIQLTDKSIAGVAPEDGKVLWKAARKGSTAVIPTPICADGYVYTTSGYGIGCNLFKVAKGSAFTATQVYANKVMVNHHGGVVKLGEYLYGHSDSEGWTCQKFQSGEAQWQEKDKLGKGSLVYADGHLYCREEAEKGVVALLEATPSGYREKGRFTPPDRSGKQSWPHPVVAGGKLYLRDQDVLLCYDVQAK